MSRTNTPLHADPCGFATTRAVGADAGCGRPRRLRPHRRRRPRHFRRRAGAGGAAVRAAGTPALPPPVASALARASPMASSARTAATSSCAIGAMATDASPACRRRPGCRDRAHGTAEAMPATPQAGMRGPVRRVRACSVGAVRYARSHPHGWVRPGAAPGYTSRTASPPSLPTRRRAVGCMTPAGHQDAHSAASRPCNPILRGRHP